jgi:CDP-diacylglycerol--glycerol-3-phosphate 3-phosphatidyltransferase
MGFKQEILRLPNLISSIRILIAPLLFVFALRQMETWFLGALIFSGFTDVLDGFIARRFNMITPLGAHLDTWGDFTIYSTMAVCAWILWPEITQRELLYYAMILFSFLLPAQIGLTKFGKMTAYHLLYAGIAEWPFILAAILCVIAGVEEILITLVLRQEKTDVRSIFAALRDRGPEDKDEEASP